MEQTLKKVMDSLGPETIEKFKKIATDKKDEILKEMKKQGINPKDIAKQTRKLASLTKSKTKKAVLVTATRQVKTKEVPVDLTESSAKTVLNLTEVVGVSCSRLSSEKTIKIWYDPNNGGKNKRATKIVGFDVGGSLLITDEEGDLTEEDFLELEKLL